MALGLADFQTVDVGGLTRYRVPGGTQLYTKIQANALAWVVNYFALPTLREIRDVGFVQQILRDIQDGGATLQSTVTDPLAGVATPAPLTARTDNLDPGTAKVLRLASVGSQNLTGIAGGSGTRELQLWNVGTSTISLRANDANSLTANRFIMPSFFNVTTGNNARVTYDPVALGWRLTGRS